MATESYEPSFDQSPEINVTPLIDVLMSLLIIFIVTSPPPQKASQPLKLPQDKTEQKPLDPNATLLVEIDERGKATLGTTPMPDDHAGRVQAFKDSEKAQADGRIAIAADERNPYGKVIEIMAAAREAGINQISIASERL